MQISELQNGDQNLRIVDKSEHTPSYINVNSRPIPPELHSSPNTNSVNSELPPLGRQQGQFAMGQVSRSFVETSQKDSSLQKWTWIFAGLALASFGTMVIAIWQFAGGI